MTKLRPGQVRDAIVESLNANGGTASVQVIVQGVRGRLGEVPTSSVRSYLRLNTGGLFERLGRGEYAYGPGQVVDPLFADVVRQRPKRRRRAIRKPFRFGKQQLYLADCLDWLVAAERNSFHAVVTDPPYGLVEYHPEHQRKMREGTGGIWRIPPSFDGASRKPLPRFTVLSREERLAIVKFFTKWARLLLPVLRPGGHVVIAGNPLVSPLVARAMEDAGFERRGEIVRLVRTFRGGDRPKGAHEEFDDVSTMPRSCWEPWGLYRRPIQEKTVAENLRVWGTGGLRRLSAGTPFLDVIPSGLTPEREQHLAPHPSIKPQAFLRQIIRAVLPIGEGRILDPFAGCATTLAACQSMDIEGVGVEADPYYWGMATKAIPQLVALRTE